jgi:hypothetical protein
VVSSGERKSLKVGGITAEWCFQGNVSGNALARLLFYCRCPGQRSGVSASSSGVKQILGAQKGVSIESCHCYYS